MLNEKIVIGVLGEQGSGKGTVVEYIKNKYHTTHFRYSQILDDMLDRLSIPKNRPNHAKLVEVLSNGFGEDFLAHAMFRDIEHEKNPIIVIEGIRRWPEVKIITHLPNFTMIFVTANEKTRYKRIITRGEKVGETELTFEEFQEHGKLSTERLIHEIGKTADFQISNDGDLGDLHKKIDEVMKKILHKS